MSKLLNTYNNLKQQDSEVLYLFKNGAFYLALQDDADFLSNTFNLKITKLNDEANKCGFPCSSFDKYYIKLNNLNKKFKIIEKDVIFEATDYLKNKEIKKIINEIKEIDINTLSVSEAFAFIENLKKATDTIS